MTNQSALDELFSALRKSSLGEDLPSVRESVGDIVAQTLQPIDSNAHAEQHPYDSLRFALAGRQKGSLRKLACELGFEAKDAGTLSDLLLGRYDHVSLETANRWTRALDLPMIPMKIPVAVCPSCLALGIREVHAAGDCGGQPIARVAILAPGEVVAAAPASKPPKRTRAACVRPYLSADLGTRIGQLRKLLAEAERQYEGDTE